MARLGNVACSSPLRSGLVMLLVLVSLTLFRPGSFLTCGTGGGGRIPPPPLNSENIKAMTTKLKGQIVRPKMFPLRSATSGDDVI